MPKRSCVTCVESKASGHGRSNLNGVGKQRGNDSLKHQSIHRPLFSLIIAFISCALSASSDKSSVLSHTTSFTKESQEIVTGSTCGQLFVLSQHFFHNMSKSPIPCNARKRAVNFSAWIHEGKILMEGGSNLTADLQYGDIFHVFSLVCSGALLVFPCLPDEGVSEATKLRRLKRGSEDTELYDVDRDEKLKSIAQELFKDEETYNPELSNGESLTNLDQMKEMLDFRKNVSISLKSGESPQEVMASYKHPLSHPSDEGQGSHFNLELVKAVCTEIQKVGDQGSSIEDVYSLVRMPGEKAPEIFILALQEFGRDQIVYYSVMIKAADNLDQETYGMKLHGHTKLGEGKHKNQNHALVITRGEAFKLLLRSGTTA
ncbi:hypothetical protein GOBAR_AA37679 [Gossypium barbadense]|uniref:Glycosyl transferase 48 domain-containing protein n=1 Tax=Gossypium barbadense TaxID=3634 RepID=A0A2P5VW29_GOSBA|nr:hypothetical protein GOBAR_AA37679 [Gossypium barbadense]